MIRLVTRKQGDINTLMKIKRQYLIPFTYDHAPEMYDFIRVNTTDMKEVRTIARCIFGYGESLTIAYEDVVEE